MDLNPLALTPLQLQQAITALQLNMAKGVTSLEVAGEKVTFRSLDDMMRTVAMLERQLDRAVGRDLPSQQYPAFRRG